MGYTSARNLYHNLTTSSGVFIDFSKVVTTGFFLARYRNNGEAYTQFKKKREWNKEIIPKFIIKGRWLHNAQAALMSETHHQEPSSRQ